MRSDVFFQAMGMAPRNEITFDDLVHEYLATVIGNAGKYQRAEIVFIAAKPFLKGKLIRSIKPADVEKFKTYRINSPTMHARERKPATVAREISELSALFTYAVKNDYCESNPVRKVERLVFDNIQNRVLSFEDEAEFFAAFDTEQGQTAKEICILVLHTGLSKKDVLGLTDFNIDKANRQLSFTRSKTKVHGDIPLNNTAWAIIEPRLGNGGLLFPSEKTGGQLTSVNKAMQGACRRVNKKRKDEGRESMPVITIRDLRRSFGSRLDTDDISKARLLTHGSTRMLPRYVRRTDRLREAVEKFDKPTPNLPAENLKLVK
jgi:integrase